MEDSVVDSNQKISEDLLSMREEDQTAVAAAQAGLENKLDEIYHKNAAKLKKLLNQLGSWPKKSQFGLQVVEGAYLIAQHSDHDLEFQKDCLILMKKLPEEEIEKWQIAYLEDRVLTNEEQPQLYGTQFYINESGEWGPRPIKDRESLDQRRSEIGLAPFEQYKLGMEKQYSEYIKNKK